MSAERAERHAVDALPLRAWLMALVAMTALPLGAVLIWLTESAALRAEREAGQHAREVAARVAAQADHLPIEAERLLAVLGRSPVSRTSIRSPARGGTDHRPQENCDPLVGEFAGLYPHYANVVQVDRDGAPLCSALPFGPGISYAGHPWFRELTAGQGFVVGEAAWDPLSSRFALPVAQPIFGAAGELRGASVLWLDLAQLAQALRTSGAAEGDIRLIDERGFLLSSTGGAGDIGRDLSGEPAVARALREKRGVFAEEGRSGTITGYALAAGGRWHVLVGLPAAQVLAPARHQRNLAIRVGLLCLLAVLAGAWLLSWRMARPVADLAATARTASRGLVPARAHRAGPREIREAALRLDELLETRGRAEVQIKESAARVEHLNRLLRTSQSIGRMLNREREREAMLDAACRILVTEGGLRGAWIAVPLPDGSVRAAARFGIELGPLASRTRWDDSPRGNGLIGRALRLGVPGVAHDVHATPALSPWQEYYLTNGVVSLAALPVQVHGKTSAAIAVYSNRAGSFDDDVVELIAEIARDLGRALEQREDEALRKGAEDALRQSEARLIVADRLATVGRLAAGVAHEINNPLAYVVMNTSAALKDLETAARGQDLAQVHARVASSLEALREAQEGSERVRLIVRELGRFSRSQDADRGPADLEQTLDSAVNIAWNEIRASAKLVKEYGDCPPVEVSGPRLGQVFLNLLLNAAQAIGTGSPEKNLIRIATWVEHGQAIAEIHDTGPGIPRALVDRIFEPFFTTKPVGSGTGLGLAICHSIVAEAKGELTVRSVEGQGAAFRVTLPLARSLPGPSIGAPAAFPVRRGRILTIDDEPAVLQAVQRVLGREHDVRIESRAIAALDCIRSGERFDVILCDLMMPEMNGIEFCAELDRLLPGAGASVLLMTGGAFGSVAAELVEEARQRCLQKPFHPETLHQAIREQLARKAV